MRRPSYRRFGAVSFRSAPLTQRGGLAVSRLDGRGISLRRVLSTRLPDPFLGSSTLSRPLPADRGELGPALRGSEDSLLAVRSATGGDVNPTCRWALSRPLVSGGHGSFALHPCGLHAGLHTSLAADFRPARGLVASQGRRSESRTPCQELFPLSPIAFAFDDVQKYTRSASKTLEISTSSRSVIHRGSQAFETSDVARCKTRWIT